MDTDERDRALEQMVERIKDDLDAAFDGLSWRQNRAPVRAARSRADGPVDVRHYSFGTARALDEDEWHRGIAIVAVHTRDAGMTRAAIVHDAVGDHEIELAAEDGRTLVFGTAAATILRGSVGPVAGPTADPDAGAQDPGPVPTAGAAPGTGAPGTGPGPAAGQAPGTGRPGDGVGPPARPDPDAPDPDRPDPDLPDAEPDIVDEVPRW